MLRKVRCKSGVLDSTEGETHCKIRIFTSGRVVKPKFVALVACDREGPQTNRRQPVESTCSAADSAFSAVERPFIALEKTFSAHPVFAPFWCQFAARVFSGRCCSFLAWQWGNERPARQICMHVTSAMYLMSFGSLGCPCIYVISTAYGSSSLLGLFLRCKWFHLVNLWGRTQAVAKGKRNQSPLSQNLGGSQGGGDT